MLGAVRRPSLVSTSSLLLAAPRAVVTRERIDRFSWDPRHGKVVVPPLPRRGSAALDSIALRITTRAPRASNFDWDDNIFNMPTRIIVFGNDGETRELDTAEWAIVRECLGKPGPWEQFHERPESHARAGDTHPGRNYFLEDIQRAIAERSNWQGPSWDAFVKAMSQPESAERSTIITARAHAPTTLHAGLMWLRDQGFLEHVVPLQNLYPVSHPDVAEQLPGGLSTDVSTRKAAVMLTLLDRLNADPHAARLTQRQWTFSDDDYDNFDVALRVLSAEVESGRWPRVKIVLHFTGHNHPEQAPRTEVLGHAT